MPGRHRNPPREEMLMIEPPPFSIMCGKEAFIIRKGPVRLMSITFLQNLFVKIYDRAARIDSGIVHHHIEFPAKFQRRVHHPFDVLVVGDIS